MDAHHAAEPTATKRTASPASSSAPLNISSSSSSSLPSSNPSNPSTTAKSDKTRPPPSASMNHKPGPASLPASAASAKKSDLKGGASVAHSLAHDRLPDDDAAAAENNSEAETIVLAGKDASPAKSRKVIKREDISDGDRRSRTPDVGVKRKPTAHSADSRPESSRPESSRPESSRPESSRPESSSLLREGSHGSNVANAGASRPSMDPVKRKRLVDHQCQKSNPDSVHAKPAKSTANKPAKDARDQEGRDRERDRDRDRDRDRERDKDGAKVRPGDRALPHKRKVPRYESDDEADVEAYKARRQRVSTSIDASASRPSNTDREHSKPIAIKTAHDNTSARRRSTSPLPRNHRRSASTQVTSSSGLSHKKKRIPPPLTTGYQSDASSGSGSPHFRSSTARGLATPATAESMGSSTKNPAHKKHIDAHGQTQLAKACSKGELENVKKRLADRPDDIDFPDYAGNTPLQCAAINGHDKIVDFLIKQNCKIECVNHDKDTPLLDAVENGHLEVVKILLDAGVNPRKANQRGQEPLDLVTDELEDADEIRDALIKAKKTAADLRRASTEDPRDEHDARSSNGADSPHRRSPSFPEPSSSRRAASSRSHKMSNKVLYMPLNVEALREAAGKGDEVSVQRILEIGVKPDAQVMIAAARGGHDGVINLLLAIGDCNPDPPLLRSGKDEEHSTPILAAIGQENVEVIKLLLMQSSFDPTKRYKGLTYSEIARKRAGPSWKEEETILKNAYDEYRRSHRDTSKKSDSRRDAESKRAGRTDAKDDSAKSLKRRARSPSRDSQRVLSKAKAGEKDYKGTSSQAPRPDEPASPKRGAAKSKKDDTGMLSVAISDIEASPRAPKSPKPRRADPDAAAMSSEGETKPHRRSRLISRKEKIESVGRRGSMVSNSSSLRDPSSPGDTRHDEVLTEKYHDRAKSIKEDETRDKPRDKLSASEHSAKRSRTSATPDLGASEKEGEPVKKRRLDVDKKERTVPTSASPDRNRKAVPSRDASGSSKHDDKPARKVGDQSHKRDSSKSRKSESTSDQVRRDPGTKSASSDKSIHVNVKAEDSDVMMRDADSAQGDESKNRATKEDEKKRRAELEAKRKQKEKEAEERKQREEEQRRQVEAKKLEDAEKEKKQEERRKQEEDARKKREFEEAQREAKEELEKRQAEAARLLRMKEELDRKRKEEERVRKEKEAAEEARRQREEDERKEQERREELRQRKIREEHERQRLGRLPASLRWLDRSNNAKTYEMAHRWRVLRGVRFDSIQPDSAGTSEGREQWVLNTQAAMLLGESDLQLTRFSSWERVPAPPPVKHLVMGLARPKPGLTGPDDWDLGRQLPGYYLGKEPAQLSRQERRKLEKESEAKFLALDLFLVKLSDLMLAIPNVSHLRNLEIVVTYHEAAETLEQHDNADLPSRWKDDPDAARNFGYCPRNKYYVNGKQAREDRVDTSSASYTPWPENRVPRDGLTAVPPTDPNYARLAKEQGLGHLLTGLRTPPGTNTAAQTSPSRLFSQRTFGDLSPPQSESTATANGDGGHHQPRSSTSSTAEQIDRPLVNGNAVPFHPVQNGADTNT